MSLIEIYTIVFIKLINLNRKLNMSISVIIHYLITYYTLSDNINGYLQYIRSL
jgi:hypothetical protein